MNVKPGFQAVKLAIGLMSVVVASVGLCQSTDGEVDKLRSVFATTATNFQLTGGPRGVTRLELEAEPSLNWSNPERGTTAGGLFLWTLNGRPEVAMCAYPTTGDDFDNEFQSLSLWPISAHREGAEVWAPEEPGVAFVTINGSQSLTETASGRMLRMRRMSREFEAKLVPPNRTAIPLRLLASPIYRYPEAKPESTYVDGAVFAFVQGTDPEVLLLLEAIENESGELSWRYAVVRMSIVPTQLRHREQLVWETKWAVMNPSTPYFVLKQK